MPLDASRPIEKASYWYRASTSYEQDGKALEFWSTSATLAQRETSRGSAQRARGWMFACYGTEAIGAATLFLAPAIAPSSPRTVQYVGLGIIAAGLIPANIGWLEYGRAVDAYNASLSPAAAPGMTWFVAPTSGGASGGIAGRF